MSVEERVRLQHMLQFALDARELAQNRNAQDIWTDKGLYLALSRCLEVIGEAASKISAESRLRHPQIPWPQIVAMRHRLIHACFDVERDLVWKTVEDDLPPLILELRAVLEN